MSRWVQWCVGASLLVALCGCGADQELAWDERFDESFDSARAVAQTGLDVRRSLAVTEASILQRFSFERVMNQLARDAKVRGLTGLDLFRQWWDTQNPGLGAAQVPHCDDELDALGNPLLNGFPYDCRPGPSEGAQASCASFSDPACAYIPIGLFNRFDLAPEDGSHCGEYRVVYAKQTGLSNRLDRNLVIFEAVVENPFPRRGIEGCRALVEAWAKLSFIDDPRRRAERLEWLYFKGMGRFPPVISFENFGANERNLGQVRTNQFMVHTRPFVWTLREFKLLRECEGRRGRCRALFVPETVKNNPIAPLFGDATDDPRAAAFQEQFVRDNVAALAATSLTDIAMSTPDAFNSGQSHSSGSAEMDYGAAFASERNPLWRALWRALGTLGSDVTPEQLVARARTQTCAGCHELSNGAELGGGLFWPPSLGFVHVSEEQPEQIAGDLRYRLSPLLLTTFLPLRAKLMTDFLQARPARRRGWGWTVGGRISH